MQTKFWIASAAIVAVIASTSPAHAGIFGGGSGAVGGMLGAGVAAWAACRAGSSAAPAALAPREAWTEPAISRRRVVCPRRSGP